MEPTHILAVAISTACATVSLVISFQQIYHHLCRFHRPKWQTKIVRILFMIPLYAITAWLGILDPHNGLAYDFIRGAYEAFLLHTFMALMFNYIKKTGHPVYQKGGYKINYGTPTTQPQLFPLCLFKSSIINQQFLRKCRIGTLQYAYLNFFLSILALILHHAGVYEVGVLEVDNAYPYITFIANCSVMIALYWIMMIYMAFKTCLKPFKPTPKFLSIKAVIFFTFWQSVAISFAIKIGAIQSGKDYSADFIGTGLHNFMITVEMCGFSFYNLYAFPLEENFRSDQFYASGLVGPARHPSALQVDSSQPGLSRQPSSARHLEPKKTSPLLSLIMVLKLHCGESESKKMNVSVPVTDITAADKARLNISTSAPQYDMSQVMIHTISTSEADSTLNDTPSATRSDLVNRPNRSLSDVDFSSFSPANSSILPPPIADRFSDESGFSSVIANGKAASRSRPSDLLDFSEISTVIS
eukprot:GILJ01015293.1.p1 GENE.GILJ01015293.1~~GILJ01015293.1.p1  ORF type:complete len:471 (-),score=51.03 GILJ01015293.1:60-1472(-)